MQSFTEYYYYDEVGNMLELDHQAGHSASFTRDFTIDTASNRMSSSVADSVTENYTYDSRGNLTAGMNHLVSMAYNDDSRLQIVAITSTLTAYYQYDRNGQRTRKTTKDTSAGTTKVRRYVGNYELYTEQTGSTVTLKRETLHVNDETGRVCLIDTKRNPSTGAVIDQLIRYQYSDHLNTAMLELDNTAAIISYEEYHPFGSTSYQAGRTTTEVSLKRYRYTSKERDEETGLYYHGARYYAPWLCRWCAVDPKESEMPDWSSYNYGFDNPIKYHDSTGNQPDGDGKTEKEKDKEQGVWYSDKKGEFKFAKGIKDQKEFSESSFSADAKDYFGPDAYDYTGKKGIHYKADGTKENVNTPESKTERGKTNTAGFTGGTTGGLTSDFINRDNVDLRDKYYEPRVREAAGLWKEGKLSAEAYSSIRYHLQQATKMQYKSAISKLMGELPPTGKPLWIQKALSEKISAGLTKISSGAGKTRALTSFISSAKFTPYLKGSLLGVSIGLSLYSVATSDNKPRAIATEGSDWAGAWAGAETFATAGAMIGGPFAPITAGVLGLIGAGVGYYFGSKVGGSLFDSFSLN